MADIKERLDNLRVHIQEPEFLEGKGLSNEVNIRIFCYDAEDEMVVRQFIDQITTDQTLGCNLIECNLYKTYLSLCEDIDIMDAIPEMEETDGKEYLLEQLHSAIGEGEFIDKIQYRTAIADLEQRIASASTAERVKLSKRLKTLQEQAVEIQGYEEKIHHLADQYIAIDLDDGVKKNYAIFGDVLAKIK